MSIILDNVNYVYSEGNAYLKHALKDINLVIGEKEFIGLIGHTGSGKSTLAQILNGLLKPSQGNMFYNGQDVGDETFDRKELRQKEDSEERTFLRWQYEKAKKPYETYERRITDLQGFIKLGTEELEKRRIAKQQSQEVSE